MQIHCYKMYLLTGFNFGNIYGKVTRTLSDQGAKCFPTREERLAGQLVFLSAQVYRALKRAGKVFVSNNNKAISQWILKLSTAGDQAVLIFQCRMFYHHDHIFSKTPKMRVQHLILILII